MERFSKVTLDAWQQFADVRIEFHPRLTVLTGANASGKTTILGLLARHAGWEMPSLATPRFMTAGGAMEFVARFFRNLRSDDNAVGSIEYFPKGRCTLRVPSPSTPAYMMELAGQQEVRCLFVPSHRAIYRYEALSQVPYTRGGHAEAYQRVASAERDRYQGGHGRSASYHMKETLIAWSILGHGNPDMAAEPELLELYEGFQRVLSRILPAELGFLRFSIRKMEVVLECGSTEFLLDAASGGLSALINLAWHLYMFAAGGSGPFTVLIDEVENHLHPTMQRRVLPDLVLAFPQVTFVVSTHSPLVVGSVRDSSVYVLRHTQDGYIRSQQLDFVNKAGSASQILSDVLGLQSTLPPWVEQQLAELVSRIAHEPLTEASFSRLRAELSEIGLGKYFPEALGSLLDAKDQ